MTVSKGSCYVVSAILLWSSLGVVIRLSGVPPHILILYSAAVSVAVLGFVVPREKYRSQIPRGRGFLHLLMLGPILLANTFTFFYAYKHTTISNAILTHHIAPVLVALMAPVFLKEVLTKRVVVSIIIASFGLWVLLGMGTSGALEGWREPGSDAMGIASGLASGVAYAVLVIVVRAFSLNFNPVVMCFFQNLTIVLILAPFAVVPPPGSLWSFVLVGLVHSTLAPVLYFRGLRHVPANRAAIIGYIEPVGAIVFGMIFLAEYPRAISMIGGVLILYSGYLALGKNNAKPGPGHPQ